jgi:hypothetical protein
LEASRQDDSLDRELSPIHLVKYVYLADLAYSEFHNGETYTGTAWRFHHYGPWALEVFQRIDPVVEEVGAVKKTVSSPKIKDDFFRYSYADDYHYNQLFDSFPFEITGALKKHIREFGKDTAELLHYVYRTRPMVCAAPGEYLQFVPPKKSEDHSETNEEVEEKLSVKRKRMKEEAIQALKTKVTAKRVYIEPEKNEWKEFTPPRYDDVYFEGVKWVESLAGDPIEPEEGILDIPDEFWKSSLRTDDDIC